MCDGLVAIAARSVLLPAHMLATRTISRHSDADHPRFLESVVGRLLDLVVYSVEGIRSRVHKPVVH